MVRQLSTEKRSKIPRKVDSSRNVEAMAEKETKRQSLALGLTPEQQAQLLGLGSPPTTASRPEDDPDWDDYRFVRLIERHQARSPSPVGTRAGTASQPMGGPRAPTDTSDEDVCLGRADDSTGEKNKHDLYNEKCPKTCAWFLHEIR